jgi:hypothetical protein
MNGEIRSVTEDRQARADRWIREAHLGITIEPDWWLRMECGWLAEETPIGQEAGIRRLFRRAATECKHFGRPRPNPTEARWHSWLQRRNLPFEPAWRHLV